MNGLSDSADDGLKKLFTVESSLAHSSAIVAHSPPQGKRASVALLVDQGLAHADAGGAEGGPEARQRPSRSARRHRAVRSDCEGQDCFLAAH
jgi:hypothetical protein